MATFMYYPGHISAASCGGGKVDQTMPMMHQQPVHHHHHHSYSVDSGRHPGSSQASMNAYGYYPSGPVQQPFFNQPVLPPPNTSHQRQPSGFLQNNLPPLGVYFGGPSSHVPAPPARAAAPILPPPVVQEPIREEYVNGGVNQLLDYDLDMMSDFVVKNAYISFGCDLNANSTQSMDLFIKGVTSVLNATRLPSATIFLALDLLTKYINRLPNGVQTIGGNSVNVIYQNSMVALVIANKFNDDKTFTNKSWTQATGMSLSSINEYEKEWLKSFEWRLFEDKFASYEDYSHTFEVFCQEKRCPSPPNLLPTPHTTDNYLSPPSGYQTPVQNNSSVYSSPCYYDEEKNDFCYNQLPQRNMMSSPSHLTTSYDPGYVTQNNFNYNFYNFGSQPTNRTWNMDESFNQQPNPGFARLDKNYFCYSAVY